MEFRVLPQGYYIGMNIPKEKTFTETFEKLLFRGEETACQIFLGGRCSSGAISSFFDGKDIAVSTQILASKDIRCVIHAAYTYNICSDNLHLQKTSIYGLSIELDFAVALSDASNYTIPVVIHTGSNPDKQKGINNAVQSINLLIAVRSKLTAKIARMKGVSEQEIMKKRRICLENCAGEGNKIGATLEELSDIYNSSKLTEQARKQLFFCIDTAHLYGKGIADFGKKMEIENFVHSLQLCRIPPKSIAVLHLNDSAAEKFSCKDRHALIGLGKMLNLTQLETKNALKITLNMVSSGGIFANIPIILEPPSEGEFGIRLLWSLVA